MAAGIALAAAAAAPRDLAGQEQASASPAARGDAAAGDPARADAKAAQRRFERIRRSALPIEERRGSSPCDARIGRYCYWYDSTAQPPAQRETERVMVARKALLSTLDSLAVASPQDPWIAGQRVRYRIDGGDTAAAVGVAMNDCRMDGWWCDALLGYAQHVAGSAAASQRTFDEMLEQMGAEDRCAWENPAILLEHSARDEVQRLPCAKRRRVADRLWWLGTPQLSRPGNDLRTEFLARRVESALEADAQFLYDSRWSWDANELLLRYGWSTWWTRERALTIGGPSEPQLVGHSRVPAFDFLPAGRVLQDQRAPLQNDDWERGGALPATRYAPRYLAWWRDATAQVARLRRGDTLLVVAAFEAPRDTMLGEPRAVLVLSNGPDRPARSSAPLHRARGVVEARILRPAAGGESLASVEVVDTARRAMARYRVSFVEPQHQRLALSDLLVHQPIAQPPATTVLADVLDHVLPTTTVAGERIGVFWETYGVAGDGEPLDLALTIERLDSPWLRRAAARLRLADPITPVHLRWRESPRVVGTVAGRTMTLNVANLASGEYRLRLRARAADGAEASSERVIEVR